MGKSKSVPAKDLLIQYFKEKLSSDQAWVERGIITLYRFQTDREKVAKETHEYNDVGFNSADARKLTKCAEWILNKNHLTGYYLNEAFKRMPKYARQLVAISNPESLQRILNENILNNQE